MMDTQKMEGWLPPMRETAVLRIIVVILAVLTGCLPSAAAADGLEWSGPEPIAYEAANPVLVPDVAGTLHVLHVHKGHNIGPVSEHAIMYMRLTEQGWSEPVDVLISPNESGQRISAALMDEAGYLHLLWGDNQSLYHSVAHASDAQSPRAWETSLVTAGSATPLGDMVLGPSDDLHVVARPDVSTLEYLTSPDGGRSWSVGQFIHIVPDPSQRAIASAQLVMDHEKGVLHVTWVEAAAETGWSTWAVWYARSVDGGVTWEDAREVDAADSVDSYLILDNQDNLHLVWGRGINRADGRWHQWSSDEGITWSVPQQIFPASMYTGGRTSGHGLAMDSAGTLHFVASFGGDPQAYHTYWQGDGWAEPQLLMGHHAHYVQLVVTLGNQLHFAAYSTTDHYLWHMDTILPAPRVAPAPLPAARPIATAPAQRQEAPQPRERVTEVTSPMDLPMQPVVGTAGVLAQPLLLAGLAALAVIIIALTLRSAAKGRRG